MPLHIPFIKTAIGWVVKKLPALQTFFLGRPRIDIDIINDPENLYGQKPFNLAPEQRSSEPILQTEADWDKEFYWNFIVRIKNNSSKTAYNIRIEKINLDLKDYFESNDKLRSLKEGEIMELKYSLRHRVIVNSHESKKFDQAFPGHLDKIEVLVKYENEGRTSFYTRFTMTASKSENEHLFLKPKN